jgi:MFS family permease
MLLMSGRTAQLIGAGVGAFAVPLIAFLLTGSVAQAGTIAAIGQVGGLVATLPAGVLADRVNRRLLIIVGAAIAALVWTSVAVALFAGVLSGWELAVALFLSTVVTSVVNPAEAGAIRMVVSAEQMPHAMAAVQGRGAVASLIAGPLGGALYGIGHAIPILASAFGELFVLVTGWLIRAPLNGDLDANRDQHPVTDLVDGLRFIWRIPLFRTAIGLFALTNLAVEGMVIAITLQLVRGHTRPILIGLIELTFGAAMLIGSLFAGRALNRFRVGPWTIATLGLLAGCSIAMAVLQTYPAYLVLLGLPLLFAPALNAGLGGYAVAITPDRMQGRLNAGLSLAWLPTAPLAPVVGSQLLANFDIGPTLWIFACALALAGIGMCFVRPLWKIGLPDTWAADAIEWPPRSTASARDRITAD